MPVLSISTSPAERAYEQFLQNRDGLSGPMMAEALQLFIVQWPSHAGAMLDLALLHCELGNQSAMEQQFQQMEQQLSLPSGIVQLIALQRQRGCSPKAVAGPPQAQWSWEAAAGYSSNANLATHRREIVFAPDAPLAVLELAPQSRQKADSFAAYTVSGQGGLVGSLQWQLGFAHKVHRQNPWLNQWGLQLGLWQPLCQSAESNGEPQSGLGLSLNQWWVHGQHQESSFRVRAEHWLGTLPQGLGRLGFAAALQNQTFGQDPSFNAGRAEAGLRWFVSQSSNWLYLGLDAYTDRPVNARPGGARRGWLGHGTLSLPNAMGRLSVVGLVQKLEDSRPYNSLFFGDAQRSQTRRQILVRQAFRRLSAATGVSEAFGVHFFLEAGLDYAHDQLELFSFQSSTVRVGLAGSW